MPFSFASLINFWLSTLPFHCSISVQFASSYDYVCMHACVSNALICFLFHLLCLVATDNGCLIYHGFEREKA